MRHILASLLLSVAAVAPASSATLSDFYSSFFVLGDSLSDNGNLGPNGAPLGYYRDPVTGGAQYSDGPVWADILDNAFNSGQPDPISGAVTSVNYAYAGANALEQDGIPDLDEQVAFFQSDLAGHDDLSLGDRPLVAVGFGGNDIKDALFTFVDDLQIVADAPEILRPVYLVLALQKVVDTTRDAARNVAAQVETLAASEDLNDFWVLNAPDIGKVPPLQPLPAISAFTTALSQEFNTVLAAELASISGPEDTITILDTFGFFQALIGNPQAFGLTNTTDVCFVTSGMICPNPEDYMFWDLIHPSSTVHGLFADYALAQAGPSSFEVSSARLSGTTAVPLPAGAPLLVAALAGLALLRRKPGKGVS